MSGRVCIARHGETDWNAAGILQGWLDIPINELGRQQARMMGESLTNFPIDAVWSSPLIRALETAQIIARMLGLPSPSTHEGLKERCFGVIQGIPKEELAEGNPVLLQQIMRRNPAAEFEQGELMEPFARRVLRAVADIGREHAGHSTLVITHGWVMDAITRHVRHLPTSALLNLKRRNGECLWVDVSKERHISCAEDAISGCAVERGA